MTPSRRLSSIGTHQRSIERLYPGRTRFEGEAPIFDVPLIVMGFTNRSGSHLLAELLSQSGRIRGFGEFLNAEVVANMKVKFGTDSFPDHVAALARSLCEPGQMFGLKASWDQFLMLLRWNIPAMFTEVRMLHMTRSDRIAQAVSHSIALQTRRWTSLQADTGRVPEFRPAEIERLMVNANEADDLIRLITLARNIPYGKAVYETLHHNPEVQMPHLLRFCGIDPALWKRRPLSLAKQADATNVAFIEQMRARLSARIDASPGLLAHLSRMKR